MHILLSNFGENLKQDKYLLTQVEEGGACVEPKHYGT